MRSIKDPRQKDLFDPFAPVFSDEAGMNGRSTYKDLVTVFDQQCEVKTRKVEVDGVEQEQRSVEVRKKTGGDVIQNPSDPEATFDGHKGPGYKVQVAETCSEENEVQLIVAAIPQTAVESDADSMEPVLDALEENGLTPEEMQADGGYGSDENAQKCAERGIELLSPASTGVSADGEPKANLLADFEMDPESREVKRCPAGHAPLYSSYDAKKEKTHVSMAGEVCARCPRLESCPVQRRGGGRYVLHFTQKRWRLSVRRRHEQTEEFRVRYRRRAGIESTHSGLKRRTGLGRVRVRGRPRVFHKIRMKCAGWNILRAARSERLRKKIAAIVKIGRIAGRFGAFPGIVFHLCEHLRCLPKISASNPFRSPCQAPCAA